MIYRFLADAVLILHFCFVLFVIFGGLLVLYSSRFLWVHLIALAWGIAVEFLQLMCPLTTLEKYFKTLAGDSIYSGNFIEHYISSIIYPGVTPRIMIILGFLLIIFNLTVYTFVFKKLRRKRSLA